ncbi:MAG: DMT family transporter [Bacteroidota bacterium]|nr:DMT family transporter [Bacteroidota bacterium]
MYKSLKLYTAIVLAMVFWSFSFIWTRVAIHSFQPMTLITLRLLIASILMFIVSKSTGKFQRLRRKDFKWFVLLAFFEPYLYYVGETYGLTTVESTLASVIVSTIPLFAPVLAFVVLRERISWATICGIIVSLVGVFFVIYEPGGGFSANPWGVALLFLAVFAAICYATVLRKIPTYYSTLNVIFYQSLLGLIFFIPTFFLADYSAIHSIQVTRESLVALFMLSVFASVIAFVLFAGAVRQVGVNRTNVFVNLIPVFTAIFSWLILDELLTVSKWIGISVVVIGLFVSQMGKLKFNKEVEEVI